MSAEQHDPIHFGAESNGIADGSSGRSEFDRVAMTQAISQARACADRGDVPVGAVAVHEGEVLAAAGNERELRNDPTAHAEVLALRHASAQLGGWRLPGVTLYITLEPCVMCAGAIVLARIPRVVFGAYDPKAGAAGSVLDVFAEPALNHHPEVSGGVMEADCAGLLRDFFASRRQGAPPPPESAPE